jgi:hypothetical protein
MTYWPWECSFFFLALGHGMVVGGHFEWCLFELSFES